MPFRHRRPLSVTAAITVLAATAVTGALITAPAAGNAAPGRGGRVYVALGDSYTSGPLIVPQTDPVTCLRSGKNYPSLLDHALHIKTFRDVSCSGATTKDFTHAQQGTVSGTNPPQYRALGPRTTLVTVGIGGNDIGLVGLAESCINLAPPPAGKSCAAADTAHGKDVYARRIHRFAPTYGEVIHQIRLRAPHAKIVLVGYPTAIRFGGCSPVQPVYARDATYIQRKIDLLNHVMRHQARLHHAYFANLRSTSVGHDACATPGRRWVEGLVPLSNSYPLHPNELSMMHAERVLLRKLR